MLTYNDGTPIRVGDIIIGTSADITGCVCRVTDIRSRPLYNGGYSPSIWFMIEALEYRPSGSSYDLVYVGTTTTFITGHLNRGCNWAPYVKLMLTPLAKPTHLRDGRKVDAHKVDDSDRPYRATVSIGGRQVELSYDRYGRFYPRADLPIDLVER